ncbi:MAG: transcriptional regulator, partial [Planctomycetota bacterium]
ADNSSRIKIIVASGPEKPYYLRRKGMSEQGCFLRVGSAVEPMPSRIIDDLFARRTRNSIGKIKSPRQDLKFEQLRIYYDSLGKTLNDQFAANLELLTETGDYNYAAYLLADYNGNSIKVAKYAGTDRVELIESNEYGCCSLVKAAKQVLDKLELENKTLTRITPRERIDQRPYDAVALREAVVNAVVHNDYSSEIPPKFELFADRLEITSAGGIPQGLSQSEFFEGYSVPRNKEIMRVFCDLEMVEHLGSGVPRILRIYSKDDFVFTDNFVRMVFPLAAGYPASSPPVTAQVAAQVTAQVKKLLCVLETPLNRGQIQERLGLKHREHFRKEYLRPALKTGLVAMTNPDKPRAANQKYYITETGKAVLDRCDDDKPIL